MTRVLVTGANGFVGRELTRRLLPRAEVFALDMLFSGPLRFTAGEQRRIGFHRIDIRDGEAIAALFADIRPDVVIHLAAMHFIPDCERRPAEAVAVNVTGTMNLLAAALPGTRFVFASSAAVYAPDDRPHREQGSPLGPLDVYGFTKLQGEQYLRHFAATRDIEGVAVRLFNVVGPGETNPHLVPEIIAQLRAGNRAIRLGNTTPRRDYIDVTDAADGFAAAALGEMNGAVCETVNLGTGHAFSVDEVLEMLAGIAGVEIATVKDPERVRRVDRPVLAADPARMQRIFGFTAASDLRAALARAWAEPDFAPALAARYAMQTQPTK